MSERTPPAAPTPRAPEPGGAYEPKGLRFYDLGRRCEMILVHEGERYAGWLCYRHPDGQWMTLRKATEDDRARIAATQPGREDGETEIDETDPVQGVHLALGFARLEGKLSRAHHDAALAWVESRPPAPPAGEDGETLPALVELLCEYGSACADEVAHYERGNAAGVAQARREQQRIREEFEAKLRALLAAPQLGGETARLSAELATARDLVKLADQRGRSEWERCVNAEGERDAWQREAEGQRTRLAELEQQVAALTAERDAAVEALDAIGIDAPHALDGRALTLAQRISYARYALRTRVEEAERAILALPRLGMRSYGGEAPELDVTPNGSLLDRGAVLRVLRALQEQSSPTAPEGAGGEHA